LDLAEKAEHSKKAYFAAADNDKEKRIIALTLGADALKHGFFVTGSRAK
jgi:hypothetical protein